jgi:hypothetical protein
MAAKPTDFFVGVTDLFSVILPGATLAYIVLKIEESTSTDLLSLLKLHGTEGYVAFLVVAYILGHLTDLIGASLIDSLYDLTYAHFRRSDPLSFFRWLIATPNGWRSNSGAGC